MTHEEIERAIGKLRELMACSSKIMGSAIIGSIVGYLSNYDACDKLIELLEQADPDTHMAVPVDADGVPIHVGDEVCGYSHPNGGVYCHAIVNPCVIAVGDMGDYSNSKGWALWNTLDVRHYHKLTVEDVLREFGDEVRRCCDTEDTIAEYAAKLREVMADDDAR